MNTELNNLVIYDGVCHFCNHSVNFIIQHDPQAHFTFMPIQSQTAHYILQKYSSQQTADNFDTILLIKNGRCFERSNAALEIARSLQKPWPVFYGLKIIPTLLRDWCYNLIARNRYRLFGQSQVCLMPTPALKARFIGLDEVATEKHD